MTKALPFAQSFLFADYKTAIRFKSETERVAFFANINTDFSTDGSDSSYQSINLKWNDGVETLVQMSRGISTDIHGMLSNNYLHVVDDNLDPENPKQFFFFITSARVINPDVVEYKLQLDVMTTYIQSFNYSALEPLFTERKHCNRFKRIGSSPNQKYIFRPDDALLGDELDDRFTANIPTTANMMPIQYFRDDSTIPTSIEGYSGNFRNHVNNELNNTLWVYAFILVDEDDTNQNGTRVVNTSLYTSSFDVGYRVLVAPIKPMALIRTQNVGETTYFWSAENLFKAIKSNTLNPLTISIRVSPVAPFNNRMPFNASGQAQFIPTGTAPNQSIAMKVFTTQTNTHADFQFLNVDGSTTTGHRWFVISGTGSTSSFWGDNANGLIGLVSYSNIYDLQESYLNETFELSMTDLGMPNLSTLPTNATLKSSIYEPKLYKLPYRKLEVSTGYSPQKEFSPLLFSYNPMRFEVNDIPTIADQKYAYSIANSSENPYFQNSKLLNKGLVGNNLYEFVVSKDKFADYVANHSNYLLTGLAIPIAQSTTRAIGQASSGNIGGAVATGIQAGLDAMTFMLQLNDLERAPDTIKSTGNNILHDYANGYDLKLKVATFELTAEQKNQAQDYYFELGYRVNRESVFVNADGSLPTGFTKHEALINRSRFNYIKLADDDLVRKLKFSVAMPIRAKMEFARIFNSGIRLIEASTTATTTIANFNLIYENMELSPN